MLASLSPNRQPVSPPLAEVSRPVSSPFGTSAASTSTSTSTSTSKPAFPRPTAPQISGNTAISNRSGSKAELFQAIVRNVIHGAIWMFSPVTSFCRSVIATVQRLLAYARAPGLAAKMQDSNEQSVKPCQSRLTMAPLVLYGPSSRTIDCLEQRKTVYEASPFLEKQTDAASFEKLSKEVVGSDLNSDIGVELEAIVAQMAANYTKWLDGKKEDGAAQLFLIQCQEHRCSLEKLNEEHQWIFHPKQPIDRAKALMSLREGEWPEALAFDLNGALELVDKLTKRAVFALQLETVLKQMTADSDTLLNDAGQDGNETFLEQCSSHSCTLDKLNDQHQFIFHPDNYSDGVEAQMYLQERRWAETLAHDVTDAMALVEKWAQQVRAIAS